MSLVNLKSVWLVNFENEYRWSRKKYDELIVDTENQPMRKKISDYSQEAIDQVHELLYPTERK